ncbi:putative ATP-dependent helicase YwqA [Paenibacillus baekrokdamisoli]|uniref:Putative ATP-dependent helicase YwqA n=1 Tax=Paenibacillus baekrokdamisoli TaxID=1712516 RepID=A0A3G9JAP6_9BACL|nr:DEAD/DEAH box helicase [Paenibacillus baekrokdamisoli]MBB3068001.1 SNF2 family DNA or RNA helicase [Paenibacillus baekrokdamisoli]BBH22951.1 putative ATP-dependent helicase YwqA [Paenibacillus baekrokdamisoli]
MNTYTDTLTVHASLSAYGDALIFGSTSSDNYVPGLFLKQRLFAWHEASFYGTELAIQQVQEVELVLLPSEQVIPFFAERNILEHIQWEWAEEAEPLVQLAPMLAACIEEKRFIPSLSAFQAGKLQWTWDEAALGVEEQALLGKASLEDHFKDGLSAAFSAAVFHRYYGTEVSAADLRREYPLLFTKDRAAAAGIDEQAWLIAIGWKADTAPFRPLLQLLEPDDNEISWRLKLVLQDKQDPAVLVPVRLAHDGDVFGSWPGAWSAYIHERSIGWLDRLRASLPAEQTAGSREDVLSSPLTDEAAWQFLTIDSQRLLEAGWQVLLPAWWEAASRKKPRLRAKVRSGVGGSGSSGGSLLGLDSLIDFDWRIAIGDTDLTEAEFADLVARNERLVRFRGQWVPLDPALLAQIRKAMSGVDSMQGLSFQDVLQLHLLGEGDGSENGEQEQSLESSARIQLEVELNKHLITLISQLGQQAEWPKLDEPVGLQAELRAYQRDGYSWLAFLRRFGLGACLADDMGLGKTVQFIAYLLQLKETTPNTDRFPSLLICPTSVLGNWQKELTRFAPSLRVMLHYGGKRLGHEDFQAEAGEADIILTSYATAALDQELLKAFTWTTLCLDEAQNIKNAQTKQSSAVRSFPARHRIALTGTPIENRLSELWSIYDFINPGYLGTSRAFNERFSNAIEKERNEQRTADLQKLVKPFMLRRKKKDPAIQLDLPDKNEMKTYIHLTAEQGALYDQSVNTLMERMQKLEGIERKGAILAALTQFKQLCDHPMLLTKEPLPETDKTKDGYVDTETLISRSAKLERLLAMVKELREEGERCLIFTQYIGMGQLLQLVLRQELQEPVLYLNGSTSKSARDKMIDQFQSQSLPAAEQPSVFILSIKAGGVGLNLTAANHVFHFDRWWNPAVENQATDRAYRMGQTRDVQVHKFISLGTLEERIDEMLENKQQLSDNVIASSEGWITELSTEALKDLFTLRRDWMGG